MGDIHFYQPSQGHRLAHDPFNAIVGPRPIGWISSQDAEGRVNLAPYSFFNAFNYKPPILGFSSIGWKDSVRNIEATGEFVWNLTTRELGAAMNQTAAQVPPEIDEFKLAGLTYAPCRQVTVPRVAESPVALECRLLQIIQFSDKEGRKLDTWLTLGEVVGVHIDMALLKDGVYDTAAAYPQITPDSMFEMLRPG
jgi:flavin reductase (DIM6/NTAB) family NADH-FMN oxidoreductase RutF